MAVIDTTGFKVGNEVNFITNRLAAKAGTYLAGDLLQKNATGNLEKCTAVENFCAIVVDDFTVAVDGNTMAVYLTGMFDLSKLSEASTFNENELRHSARAYNIFFVETK